MSSRQARAGSNASIGKRPLLRLGTVATSIGSFTIMRSAFKKRFGISMKKAEILGKGQYGEVFKVTDPKLGAVAVKVVRKSGLKEPAEKIFIKSEKKIHLELDHPHIAKLHETFTDGSRHYFVLELLGGGELFDRIFHETDGNVYTEKTAALVTRNLAEALFYLHERQIVHRDIKPENLLLPSKEDLTNVKLVDFGVAAKCKEPLRSPYGTLMYIAPEILNEQPYKTEIDMWSFGVLLFSMLSGMPPFFHPDEVTMAWQIRNQGITFDAKEWNLISPEAKDLVARLLDRDVRRRFTAKDVLEHEWVKNAEEVKDTDIHEVGERYNQFKAKSIMMQAIQGLKAIDKMKNLMEKIKADDTKRAKKGGAEGATKEKEAEEKPESGDEKE